MTPADVLRKAADYIAGHGWLRFGVGDDGGPRCAVGAICSVTGSDFAAMLPPVVHEAWTAAEAHIGVKSLAQWNDTPGRTAEEVIATLRSVADRIERGDR